MNETCFVRICSVDEFPGTIYGENFELDKDFGCYCLEKPFNELINVWKLILTIHSYGWEVDTLAIHPDLWEKYDFIVYVEIFEP